MAGTRSSFNADRFKAGIRVAMEMGQVPDTDLWIKFHFESQLVYDESAPNDTDLPFDPDLPVTRVTPAPKHVDCAIEFFDAQGRPTNFGNLQATRIHVLLLDDEYEQVKDAIYVTLGDTRWDYDKLIPPRGLFDVGIYTIAYAARGNK